MARSSGALIIAIYGHAVRIDPATGTELWRTKLKRASFPTVSVDGNRVYAGASGELFCLDKSTGEILWRNRLKGLGLGTVAFAGSNDVVGAAAAAAPAAAGARA
jgi:outer membrane protein assembly factor BamB